MSKKSPLAAMEALKGISQKTQAPATKNTKKPAVKKNPGAVAGQAAADSARKKASSKKSKVIGFRTAKKDLDIIEDLAIKLKRHGLQYSEANAIRLALRLFKASDAQIEAIAQEIKDEDGRRKG